tara:strand:- start:394 stop:546 length:153 start_codon:yes stop_codon:yes gene_type:complete
LTIKLEDQVNQQGFLIEYFSGIEKGGFYEKTVQENILTVRFKALIENTSI